MLRLNFILLLLAAMLALVSASAPTFCKCTCFKNSTIIPLGPQHPSADAAPAHRSVSKSCSECTKTFCLNQGIEFCKKAEEDDVVTMCFQRDSNKDKIIVWGFIFGTTGLLGWAAFKKVAERREVRAIGRQEGTYAPVGGRQ